MCVTVCNIGHDQNQQFICNERKAAQLASVFQTSNITTNNRFCNQINTSIMHNIRVDITNDPGSRHRQQTVISANAVFCHRIFLLLLLSSRSSCWLTWSEHLQSWHVTTMSQTYTGRDKKVGAPWQHPTPPFRPPLVSQLWLWPLIGQQGPTQPAGHCLLCVDLWQTPTLIGGILTQLSTLRHWTWWLASDHCMNYSSQQKQNVDTFPNMRIHRIHTICDINMRQ